MSIVARAKRHNPEAKQEVEDRGWASELITLCDPEVRYHIENSFACQRLFETGVPLIAIADIVGQSCDKPLSQHDECRRFIVRAPTLQHVKDRYVSEHNSFDAMLKRARPKSEGGEGALVTRAWNGYGRFVRFLWDMGPKPAKGMHLHCIDPKAHQYGPPIYDGDTGSEWTTRRRNMDRKNNRATYNLFGQHVSCGEAAATLGMKPDTLKKHIQRRRDIYARAHSDRDPASPGANDAIIRDIVKSILSRKIKKCRPLEEIRKLAHQARRAGWEIEIPRRPDSRDIFEDAHGNKVSAYHLKSLWDRAHLKAGYKTPPEWSVKQKGQMKQIAKKWRNEYGEIANFYEWCAKNWDNVRIIKFSWMNNPPAPGSPDVGFLVKRFDDFVDSYLSDDRQNYLNSFATERERLMAQGIPEDIARDKIAKSGAVRTLRDEMAKREKKVRDKEFLLTRRLENVKAREALVEKPMDPRSKAAKELLERLRWEQDKPLTISGPRQRRADPNLSRTRSDVEIYSVALSAPPFPEKNSFD